VFTSLIFVFLGLSFGSLYVKYYTHLIYLHQAFFFPAAASLS